MPMPVSQEPVQLFGSLVRSNTGACGSDLVVHKDLLEYGIETVEVSDPTARERTDGGGCAATNGGRDNGPWGSGSECIDAMYALVWLESKGSPAH